MLTTPLLRLVETSGLNRLWAFANRHRITILRYHGVIDESRVTDGWLTNGPLLLRDFRDQLRTLLRRYRVISLDEALAVVAGQASPRPYSVVLTFDDGYRNNATIAYPVLRELDLPATIFLVTDFVQGERPLWFDRLEWAIARADIPELDIEVGSGRARYRLDTLGSKSIAFRALLGSIKAMDLEAAEPILRGIEGGTGHRLADGWLAEERFAPLCWDQVHELRRGKITFGSHTASHQILTVVPPERAQTELRRARQLLEQRLGEACALFAYPNGDFSGLSESLLREDRYRCALTTIEGTARRGDNLLALRRLAAGRARSSYKLLAELSGVLPWLLRIRGKLTRPSHHSRDTGSPSTSRSLGR